MGVLDDWKVTRKELDEILSTRPTARGYLFGFVAEYKLTKMHFTDPRISGLGRARDHERSRPGDMTFNYKGVPVSVSSKSLQTNSVRAIDGGYTGSCQCDASDKRTIRLPNNEVMQATNLVVGGFDLLSVNIFHFGQQWRFAFAKNIDLPRSKHKRYTEEQRKYLLATGIPMTWPLGPPFRDEPFTLLDEIVKAKLGG
jgi:hypothetical protein